MLRQALLIAALGAMFVGALTHLFLLRFRTGDVYPICSTLRADPLGTKAYYQALSELPHLDVRRNYRRGAKLRTREPATLLYIGTPHRAYWGDEELQNVEALATEGTRVVITFLPVLRAPASRQPTTPPQEQKTDADTKPKDLEAKSTPGAKEGATPPLEDQSEESRKSKGAAAQEEERRNLISFDEVAQRWGFAFRFLQSAEDLNPASRRAELAAAESGLEPGLRWGSVLNFELKDPAWQPLYTCSGKPVIAERRYGAGSIVLAADSYFLSNEALRKDRAPQLLAWLAGSAANIIFDEESHGTRENPGIASLVRKYQLHGLAAGLLVLAVLFIWKNASRFIPPHEAPDADGEIVRGKEAAEGFSNLLRRSIPPAEIIATCAAEWRKSFHHEQRDPKAALVEELLAAEQARPARERNPAALYRSIAQELAKKHHKKK
jgi:hypothetical protein